MRTSSWFSFTFQKRHRTSGPEFVRHDTSGNSFAKTHTVGGVTHLGSRVPYRGSARNPSLIFSTAVQSSCCFFPSPARAMSMKIVTTSSSSQRLLVHSWYACWIRFSAFFTAWSHPVIALWWNCIYVLRMLFPRPPSWSTRTFTRRSCISLATTMSSRVFCHVRSTLPTKFFGIFFCFPSLSVNGPQPGTQPGFMA